MKVEKSYVIDGEVVSFETKISDIDVFVKDKGDDQKTLYFVKSGIVIKILKISAGCGQNCGFISECEFSNIK